MHTAAGEDDSPMGTVLMLSSGYAVVVADTVVGDLPTLRAVSAVQNAAVTPDSGQKRFHKKRRLI